MYDIEKANTPLVAYNGYSGDLPASHKRPHNPSPVPAGGVRDPIFLFLFLANLLAVSYYAFTDGLDQLKESASGTDGHLSDNAKKIIYAILALCGITTVISGLLLTFLMRNAESLIRITLWWNILICFALALVLVTISPILTVVMLLAAALNWCYMRAVQSRIPFASANLKVACSAIREHFAVVAVSYLVVIMGVAWSAVWCLAAWSVFEKMQDDTDTDNSGSTDDEEQQNMSSSYSALFFFLSISFYWGQEVLKNVSHVTTAGSVASWWYSPNATGVVSGSFCRATTSSLGSIAFGSLIVAVLQVLEDMARKNQNQNGGIMACMATCIIACFKNMAEYFNRWAFVYVGIYGDSFIKSGKAVCALFKNRGWSTIINDNLIQRTLGLLALAVGLVVGGAGAAIGSLDTMKDIDAHACWYLFGVGFFIGLFLTMIMVSVVDSAVATVFVCFAESPQVFEQTHPALFYNLTATWRETHNIHM